MEPESPATPPRGLHLSTHRFTPDEFEENTNELGAPSSSPESPDSPISGKFMRRTVTAPVTTSPTRRNTTPHMRRGGGGGGGEGSPRGGVNLAARFSEEGDHHSQRQPHHVAHTVESDEEDDWQRIQVQRSRSFAQINGRAGAGREGQCFFGEDDGSSLQNHRTQGSQPQWQLVNGQRSSSVDVIAGEDQFVLRMNENHHGHHHKFEKVSLAKVVKCDRCGWFIWGFMGNPVICQGKKSGC